MLGCIVAGWGGQKAAGLLRCRIQAHFLISSNPPTVGFKFAVADTQWIPLAQPHAYTLCYSDQFGEPIPEFHAGRNSFGILIPHTHALGDALQQQQQQDCYHYSCAGGWDGEESGPGLPELTPLDEHVHYSLHCRCYRYVPPAVVAAVVVG